MKNNLLSKEDIINYLKENGATESELCELNGCDTNYFTVYPNTDPFLISYFYIGYTIVKCKEGFLSLPVIEYDTHNGYEQYDLDKVEIIDKEIVEKYYEEFKRQLGVFEAFIAN